MFIIYLVFVSPPLFIISLLMVTMMTMMGLTELRSRWSSELIIQFSFKM